MTKSADEENQEIGKSIPTARLITLLILSNVVAAIVLLAEQYSSSRVQGVALAQLSSYSAVVYIAIGAINIVLLFKLIDNDQEFEFVGLKAKGAAASVFMWVGIVVTLASVLYVLR